MNINYKNISSSLILVLSGSLSDISEFDFHPFGLDCMKINSDKFDDYLKTYSSEDMLESNKETFNQIGEEFGDKENLFVLVPLNLKKSKEDDFYLVWQLLLLMFPSDISVYRQIDLEVFDYKKIRSTSQIIYYFHHSGIDNFYDNFLLYDENKLPEINRFIKIFKNNFSKQKYLNLPLNSYTSSFKERRIDLQYIGFCISLESVINNTTELNYRISRNMGIICGHNKNHSKVIYENAKKIYILRSKIVHGIKPNYKKVEEYLKYIKFLVSRLICELVLHNLKNIDVLNSICTKVGFGDYEKLSDNYEKLEFNISSYFEITRNKL